MMESTWKMNKPISFLDLKADELRRMDADEAKALINVSIIPEFNEPVSAQQVQAILTKDGELKLPFGLAVLIQRLTLTQAKYAPAVVMMAGILSNSPGDAVMWAYTLFLLAQHNNAVTLDDLIMGPFAEGFPTDEAKARIWDAQKKPGAPLGNLLDAKETWELETA
jgi:hypothetical protein